MVSPSVALRLAAAAFLLSSVAFAGGAMAAAPTAEIATADTAAAAVPTSDEKPNPACTRKIKVVYAGYGEADRLGCTTSAKTSE